MKNGEVLGEMVGLEVNKATYVCLCVYISQNGVNEQKGGPDELLIPVQWGRLCTPIQMGEMAVNNSDVKNGAERSV